MIENQQRLFNCKDEEFIVVCKFVEFSFNRDTPEFIAFSPKFGGTYGSDFSALIVTVDELISPESETLEMKKITERMFNTIHSLLDPINRLQGYIEMAFDTLKISATDFGLSSLREAINNKDPEKVIAQLKKIKTNLNTYQGILTPLGLTPALIAVFNDDLTSITYDKQQQYEILTNRKAMVQNNIGVLNQLYTQLQEILKTGKILYKNSDPVKLQEYTFTDLLKRVTRKSSTPDEKVTIEEKSALETN